MKSAVAGVLGVSLFGAAPAFGVEIQVAYNDEPGRGFYDETTTPVVPGNEGKTLGEQRQRAFEYALGIWRRALRSDVPIKVVAEFAPEVPLYCDDVSAVTGSAAAVSYFESPPGGKPGMSYLAPLADHLAGEDLDPDGPDVWATFNADIDTDECLGELGWDYSIGTNSGSLRFVNTVLHELAHALGFAPIVSVDSGSAPFGVGPFESMLLDVASGRHWDELSSVQRASSAQSPFGLAWDGPAVTDAAPQVLASGRPRIEVQGEDAVTLVGEAGFGPRVPAEGVEGTLTALTARAACEERSSLDGRIALLGLSERCNQLTQLLAVQERGAVAAILESAQDVLPPWAVDARVTDSVRVTIAALAVSREKFQAWTLQSESAELTARLSMSDGLVGTTRDGLVLMNATRPIILGSSVGHWDRSVRRPSSATSQADVLLLEPVDSGATQDVLFDLTLQLLQDIGWNVEPKALRIPASGTDDEGHSELAPEPEPGCSCHAPGQDPNGTQALLVGLALWTAKRRRRRGDRALVHHRRVTG